MGVIEAEACRLRNEGNPAHPVLRHEGRAFLGCSVDVAGDDLAVPVHELRRIGVIVDVHHDLLSFLESEQGPRKLAVVERRGDDMIRSQFDQAGRDTQAVVGLGAKSDSYGAVTLRLKLRSRSRR